MRSRRSDVSAPARGPQTRGRSRQQVGSGPSPLGRTATAKWRINHDTNLKQLNLLVRPAPDPSGGFQQMEAIRFASSSSIRPAANERRPDVGPSRWPSELNWPPWTRSRFEVGDWKEEILSGRVPLSRHASDLLRHLQLVCLSPTLAGPQDNDGLEDCLGGRAAALIAPSTGSRAANRALGSRRTNRWKSQKSSLDLAELGRSLFVIVPAAPNQIDSICPPSSGQVINRSP